MNPLNLLAVKKVCGIPHDKPAVDGQFGDREVPADGYRLGPVLGDLSPFQ